MSPTRKTARPARRRQVERRRLPRIPMAVPIRYATELGDIGIGVLIDVHQEGAGLLIPHLNREAFHVWLQFLWFDDNVGAQGRITFVREVPEGFHVGLQLQLVSTKIEDFITNLLIPFGLRKFRHDRRKVRSLAHVLALPGRDPASRRTRRYFPVLVAQGTTLEWAITEYRDDRRAVLLLPRRVSADAPLILTSWGRPGVYKAEVLESETLALPPVTLYRAMVRFERLADGTSVATRPDFVIRAPRLIGSTRRLAV